MSKIKLREGADLMEGIRLSFNAAMFRNLFRKQGGTSHHDDKLKAEEILDKWLVQNIEGINEPDNESQAAYP